jgi:hypothetical protein
MCLWLVVLSQQALREQSRFTGPAGHVQPHSEVPRLAHAGLAISLTFSEASLKGLYLGQLGAFTAMMLLLALIAQGRGQPVRAGVCLFLATVKFVTMIPFLILFLRRADRLTWAALLALVIASCSLTGTIADLPARLATLSQRAEELSARGKVNDYSYEGTRNESIISFEHAFYRLGMRDRRLIRCAQLLAVVAVGAWITYLALMTCLPRPAAVCLVSFLSLLFIYHRDYDTVILALPLSYCAAKVRSTAGRIRYLYIACGLIVIAILYADGLYLRLLTERWAASGRWDRLVQATILPCFTWLILLAMLVQTLATCAEGAIKAERKSPKGRLAISE